MKRLLLSLLFILSCIHQLPSREPTIIYFKGSCSAGKTTFIKSLKETLEELSVVDEDEMVFANYLEAIESRFPAEFREITRAIEKDNIYHSIRTTDHFFKAGSTEEERLNAEKAIITILSELNHSHNLDWKKAVSGKITKICLRQIENALQNNKYVLVDSWYIKPEQLQELFPDNPCLKVILYCPLEMAYARLLKRNTEAYSQGNSKEKRLVSQLIGSFTTLYEITDQPLGSIEEVDLSFLTKTFETIAKTLSDDDSPKPLFSFKELIRSEFFTLQSKFLEPFEINGLHYIKPKEKYDLIIDTRDPKMDILKIRINNGKAD